MKVIRLVLFAIVIAVSTSGCGWDNKEAAEVETRRAVTTYEVTFGEVVNTYISPGEVLAWSEIKVVPKTPGRVAEVLVDLGERVQQGQILVRLEDEEHRAQVQQAAAALEAAKASLAKIEAGARVQEFEQAKAALLQAEVNYDYARHHVERMTYLFENKTISAQDLEGAQVQLQMAEAQYVAAKEQLSLIEEGATQETIDQLRAQVRQAEAALDYAQVQLANTVIPAPLDGVIAKRDIEVGEMANQAAPILTLVQDNPLRIVTFVSQQAINYLSAGTEVSVKIDGKSYQGEITAIGPAADPLKRGFPVEIKLANQAGLLKPGMYGEIAFETDKASNCVVIPKEAILKQGDTTIVYRVDEHLTARRQEVTTGIANAQWVEITTGLVPGETVVIKGQYLLQDGMSVAIRNGSDTK